MFAEGVEPAEEVVGQLDFALGVAQAQADGGIRRADAPPGQAEEFAEDIAEAVVAFGGLGVGGGDEEGQSLVLAQMCVDVDTVGQG